MAKPKLGPPCYRNPRPATPHWIKMRRTSAVLYRRARSRQFPSFAGCIINTSGVR